jgi:hypothetical protein
MKDLLKKDQEQQAIPTEKIITDFLQNVLCAKKMVHSRLSTLVDLIINLAKKMMLFILLTLMEYFLMTGIRGINKSRKSRKIYGGLNNNDFLLIKEMKDRNKLDYYGI